MIFIVLNIMGFISFCAYMIVKPSGFADLIVRFSEKTWFHPFEIASRAIIGAGLWYFATETPIPMFFKALGILLMAVSVGLLLFGAKRHRAYALWSAEKFRALFRPAGILFLPMGIYLLMVVLDMSLIS